jgi:hypothetical protein
MADEGLMSLNKILGGLLKVLTFWKKGHDAGYWSEKPGPGVPVDPGRPTRAEKLGRGF